MYTRALSKFALATLLAATSAAQTEDYAPRDARPDWPGFESTLSGHLHPRFEPESGRFIEATGMGRVVDYPITENNLADVALDVVTRAERVLGVRASDLEEVHRTTVAETHAVRYAQRLDGYPVRGSRVELRLGENGQIYALWTQNLVRGPLAAPFRVPSRDAGELARLAPPTRSDLAYAWQPERVVLATREGDQIVPRPAWEVRVSDPSRPDGSWIVTLDGETGVTLEVESQILEGIDGNITGRGIPSKPQITGGPPVVSPMVHMHVSAFAADEIRLTDDTCKNDQQVICGDGTRVVYVVDCGGGATELWTAAPDGTGLTLLLSNGAKNHSPDMSDNGARIFFVSDVDGDDEIFRINSDGTGLTQLTTNTAIDRAPSVADSGAFVVFESNVDGDFEIYRKSAFALGVPTQLTSNDWDDREPWLGGDGTKIAWAANGDGDSEIFIMDADGSSQTQLTFNQVEDRRPTLPDDAVKVLFESRMSSFVNPGGHPHGNGPTGNMANNQFVRARRGPFHIWAIDPDGSDLEQVTFGYEERDVVISGIGNIAAYSARGSKTDDWEIHLQDLGTNLEVAITKDDGDDRFPSVSDDGLCGARQSNADGDWEVWAWCAFFGGDITDTIGDYSIDMPDFVDADVYARLRGKHAKVYDLHPAQSNLAVGASVFTPEVDVDMLFNPTGFDEYPTAQVMGYQHTDLAFDYLEGILLSPPLSLPGPLPFDEPLKVRVNVPFAIANAYYDTINDHTTYFMGAGPLRPNTAYQTVIYHEYGHFMDDRSPGGIDSGGPCETRFARSEAIGDIVSTFASGQGVVGRDFFGAGTSIRDYTTIGDGTQQWDCLDCPFGADGKPEEHVHGTALAGFAWDVRTALGAFTAEPLILGALTMDAPDMQKTVFDVFVLAGSPAFGGTGHPATSPLYGVLCEQAAKHGFTCPEQGDFGSHLCMLGVCGTNLGRHEAVVTEWLGPTVTAFDGGCGGGDDDGATVPPFFPDGELLTIPVKMSVDPDLQFTGRYGGLVAPGAPNPLRVVYLNAWLFIDGPGPLVGPIHVVGTGSMGTPGDVMGIGIAPDTCGFYPDLWPFGVKEDFEFTFMLPDLPEDAIGLLRIRFDYGEDAGKLKSLNCLTDASLTGPCGPARFGEVEDYQFTILNDD